MRISPSFYSLIIFFLFQIQNVTAQISYSLASFDKQTISGLSPACSTVYNTAIAGCMASDFIAMNPCSAACINGLISVQTQAQAACATAIINLPYSMLAYFAKGQGVTELCTTQKAAAAPAPTPSPLPPTTMVTSVRPPSGTNTYGLASTQPSTTPDTSSAASIVGSDTRMSLPGSTVIGIIVAVVVAFAIFLIIAVILYRRHYRE